MPTVLYNLPNKRSASSTTQQLNGNPVKKTPTAVNSALNFVKNGITSAFKGAIAGHVNFALGVGTASVPAPYKAAAAKVAAAQANAAAGITTFNKGKNPIQKGTYLNKPKAKANDLKTDVPLQPAVIEPDSSYKWNLPPHQWSLPIDPSIINSDTVVAPAPDLHATRRGKIFFAQRYVGPTVTGDPKTAQFQEADSDKRKYGFQFMWNPETFNQTTSVNMNITPSETDATSGLTGLVAANSNISFTLRIDRTNDFACAKASSTNSELKTFYTKGQPLGSTADFGTNIDTKITNLLKYGTASDLEYLYRTINGGGFTKLGVETSEIGYLMPTIIRLDLGPQKYMGIISSVSVNHLAFNRDMVPIRTDVSITVDLRAGTGYTTSGVAGSSVPQSHGGGL